jgi:hypothetical protein
MNKTFIRIVKKSVVVRRLRNWTAKRRLRAGFAGRENKDGSGPPSHAVKQGILRDYSRKYGLRILVETGTYQGDMVEAMRDDFDRIYSIELSGDLCQKAMKRFKGVGHVEIVHGDSGNELQQVLRRIHRPALFWLDGHYSGGETARGKKDTPICEELLQIFGSEDMRHVILIDDARLFGTDPAYPKLDELGHYVKSRRPGLDIVVHDDIIRITAGP